MALFIPALDQFAALLNDGAIFIVLILTLIIAHVYRYGWISTPAQHQQTKWVVFELGIAAGSGR
jgi:hypothetical protein